MLTDADVCCQELLRRVFQVTWSTDAVFTTNRPIFCHFATKGCAAVDAPYALVEDAQELPARLYSYLQACVCVCVCVCVLYSAGAARTALHVPLVVSVRVIHIVTCNTYDRSR